jgi:hypothetical protein
MKYRKKPVVVEAFRFGVDFMPEWFNDEVKKKAVQVWYIPFSESRPNEYGFSHCDIRTLEGVMRGNYGDYIIKGVNGELYPCKADIFEKTYEKFEDTQ